jgi:cation:H+ antiporter
LGTIIELVLSIVGILIAAALFTNSIEMLGDRMNLGQGAVGSVLAAVGTALPETMIPVVAILGALILGGDPAASGEIGVGAILGAPFLLATLAAFVIGAATIIYKDRRETGTRLNVDRRTVRRDMVFFFLCFGLAAGVGVANSFFAVPFFVMVAVAVGLVGAYVVHVVRTVIAGGEGLEDVPDDLTLWPESRFGEAPTWAVVAQVIGSLAVMALGAHYFVEAVRSGSETIGIPAGLIALVLAPLATELPEKFNSVIWLRDNKDTLAIGNITGAMVFQSTIPVSLGLVFTSWSLDSLNALSAGLALLGGALIIAMLLSKGGLRASFLLGGGILYVVFLGAAIYQLAL